MKVVRAVSRVVLSPFLLAALALGGLAVVFGNVWEVAGYSKKDRRDLQVAVAINRLVKAAEGEKK